MIAPVGHRRRTCGIVVMVRNDGHGESARSALLPAAQRPDSTLNDYTIRSRRSGRRIVWILIVAAVLVSAIGAG